MTKWLTDDAIGVITKLGHGSWVENIDDLVSHLCEKFALVPVAPLTGGTLSAVVRCTTSDGSEVVLKASPSIAALERERRFFARLPVGVAPLVHASEPGALVLEFLSGTPESGCLADESAVTELLRLNLWSTDEPGSLSDITEMLEKISSRLALRDPALAATFDGATPLIRALWCEPPVWCHGDLQAENVFWDGLRLRVIDPLPLWAPLGMDLGYWAADPLRPGLPTRRISLLATSLGIPEMHLTSWTTFGAAQHLSWLWHYDVRPELARQTEVTLRHLLGES